MTNRDPNSPTASRRVKALERENKALDLRIAGASFRQIAVALDLSEGGAFKVVHRALAKLNEKNTKLAEDLRALEDARLNRLLVGIWNSAANGDLFAIDRALKISAALSRLHGLEVMKVAPTTPDGAESYSGGGLSAILKAWQEEHAQDDGGVS